MKPRRVIVTGLSVLGALFVLLSFGALYFFTCTEQGLREIAARLGRIGATTVHVEDVGGTLVGGFTAGVIDVRHPRAHVRLQHASGRLALLPLLWRTITVTEGSIDDALVEVLPGTRPAVARPNARLRFMPAGMTVRSEKLHVERGALVLISGTRYDVTDFNAAAIVRPAQIRILRGDLDWQGIAIDAVGELRAADPMQLAGDLHFTWQTKGQPRWLANARIDGDLERLPITGSITAPLRADFAGDAVDLTSAWHFDGKAQLRDLDITVFGGGGALGRISGELDTVTVDRAGYTARGVLTPAGLEAGPMNVDFAGSYAARVLTIASASATHRGSTARATTHGTITLDDDGPLLALRGEWQRFRWPLVGNDPPVRSVAGTYTLSGQKPYAFTLRGDLLAADFPSMDFDARGSLPANKVVIDAAAVHVLNGTAQVSGEAAWAPQPRWALRGDVAAIDPARLRKDLPGSLSFGFDAAGDDFAKDAPLRVTLSNLRGRLRAQNAAGSGSFSRNRSGWTLQDVDLRVGSAHATADGTVGSERNLRFAVTADDLSLLAADAQGKLTASGEIKGTETEPVLRLQAQGSAFRYDRLSLRSIDADIDMDMHVGGTTRARIRGRDLLYGTRTVNGIDIDVTGTAADHGASIHVQATKIGLNMNLRGAYARGDWQGSLTALDIDDGEAMKLTLAKPADLALSAVRQHVGELCLTSTDARICGSGDNAVAGWKLLVDARNLPMSTLTAGLSQNIEYDGRLGVSAEASGAGDQPWIGTLAANLSGAQLRHRLANGREERFALGTGKIGATATRDAFNLQVGLDAAESGRIDAGLQARRTGTDWEQFPVSGSLSLETDGLGILDVYITQVDRIAGRLRTSVTVTGTLGTPRLDGELHLEQGEIDLYQINLAMRETKVDARFNDTSLDLTGSTRAGDGNARLNGRITWRNREPYGDIHLEGEDLLLVNVPEARLQASPKLDFKIAARHIDVSGEVKVPYGRLEPADITNAVLPSADEVLVGAEERDPAQQFQVVTNVTITLGDRVTIDTYGLTGRLTGSIATRTDESQVSRGSGELNVAEGKYTAFGRKLDIERGRLLFNNGPLADPAIDIRAVKVFPDVTAGANVRGTLRQPRMTFFSTPAIPQSQIVSLILAGGSLESVQNSSRPGAARNDLLAQGGAILAQQLGSRVGIQDVGIESDINNETSLVLGKYLSPRLYVSYGISLAEAINTVKMRFTIDDHWTIKTESGKERSADLVFTIQR